MDPTAGAMAVTIVVTRCPGKLIAAPQRRHPAASRDRRRPRGAARPSRRAVLGAPGRGRLVDPEGRVRRRRGSARRRPARVRRGARTRAAGRASRPTWARSARSRARSSAPGRWPAISTRPDPQQHVHARVAAAVGPRRASSPRSTAPQWFDLERAREKINPAQARVARPPARRPSRRMSGVGPDQPDGPLHGLRLVPQRPLASGADDDRGAGAVRRRCIR